MKKILFVLVSLAVLYGVSFSQWQVQAFNPPYLGSHFAAGSSTGWIVGLGGIIRKTTDAGISWENQNSGTTTQLNSVCFINFTNGWAVGENGTILYTSNGGTSWVAQNSGVTERLLCVNFYSGNGGLIGASSGKILRSVNGGVNWSVATVPGINQNILSIQMRSLTLAYATAGNFFLKTTDGGINWTSTVLTRTVFDIHFTDDNTGYGVTDVGSVLKTTNAGVNWTEYLTGNSSSMFAVTFINSTTGYIGGLEGKIYKSTNSGANWSLVHNISGMVEDLSPFGASQLFACTQSGSTAYMNSAGTLWFNTGQGNGGIIYDMHFINPSTGWAVNYNSALLSTTNGGVNWSVGPDLNIQSVQTICFINSSTGFITGYTGSDGASNLTIGKTTNSGANWQEQTFPGESALNLQFVNTTDGFALFKEFITGNYSYKIYKTTNTGTNWQLAYTTASVMNDFYFTTHLNGWMCGNGGVMLKTTNGGVNWSAQTTGVTDSLLSVYFQNANSGWACGTGGRIIATTNGGANWQTQSSGTTVKLNDIEFGSVTTGVIAGNNGTRLVTFNGGASWTSNQEISRTNLMEVCFAGSSIAFVGGDWGYISVNSALTAIEPVNNIIPADFILNQNYPNPFNPATRIAFSIPGDNDVSLRVYDVTGKEAAVLINSNMSAGNYNIEFNAAGLSSGVYFYKLTAGNFSQIKKLVLIK